MKYKAKYFFSILYFFFITNTHAQTILTFEECLNLAFKNNLNIRNAVLSEEIAKYQRKGAITKLLPTISGSVSNNYSWGRGIDPSTNTFVNQ